MALTPDTAAANVAAALNGAGLTAVVFTRGRFPKYGLKELTTTKAHVVPVWPARMEQLDDIGLGIETPIAVTLDARCEKTDDTTIAELTDLLEEIAAYLSSTDLDGLGYPIESPVIDRNEELLDQGHFCGGVGVVYRRYRDGGAA